MAVRQAKLVEQKVEVLGGNFVLNAGDNNAVVSSSIPKLDTTDLDFGSVCLVI